VAETNCTQSAARRATEGTAGPAAGGEGRLYLTPDVEKTGRKLRTVPLVVE